MRMERNERERETKRGVGGRGECERERARERETESERERESWDNKVRRFDQTSEHCKEKENGIGSCAFSLSPPSMWSGCVSIPALTVVGSEADPWVYV